MSPENEKMHTDICNWFNSSLKKPVASNFKSFDSEVARLAHEIVIKYPKYTLESAEEAYTTFEKLMDTTTPIMVDYRVLGRERFMRLIDNVWKTGDVGLLEQATSQD